MPPHHRLALFVRSLRALVLGALVAAPVAAPLAVVGLVPVPAQAQAPRPVEGDWQGTLHMPNGNELRLLLRVEKTGDTLKGTLFTVNDWSPPMNTDKFTFSGGSLSFNQPDREASFEGKLSADGNSVAGSLSQNGKSNPLVFVRPTPDNTWTLPPKPAPIVHMDPKADPAFEVATVKPTDPAEQRKMFSIDRSGASHIVNMSLEELLTQAFELHSDQLANLPDWAHSAHWDIQGRYDVPGMATMQQSESALRKLLVERFGLKFHNENRDLTAYQITIAKGGQKLKLSDDQNGLPGLFFTGIGKLEVHDATIKEFAGLLQNALLSHPVLDRTDLGNKRWDFKMKWQMDDDQMLKAGMPHSDASQNPTDAPPLLVAMPEQLGLEMKSGKTAVPVMVVDHLEKPSAN